MRLAFFGGTFNPPHLGHRALALAATEALSPDILLWIPTGDPPHKSLPPETPALHHRLEMTRLAAAELPHNELCTLEIDRNLRYTADTLEALRERYKPEELWLLCGADMLCTMEQWREPERLFSLCSIAAFARERAEAERLSEQARFLGTRFGARIRLCPHEVLPLSSTELRACLPLGEGAEGLSPAVYDYICAEKLYGVTRELCLSLPLLRRLVHLRLSPARAAHVLGTEETAAALARIHNLSEIEARQAALLHDITKEEANQLKLLESCDILPAMRAELPRQLWHAWTAAEAAARRGASSDVVNAVRHHSTGRPGMSPLEAVIFLSDKTEPNRPPYPQLDDIRAASRRDLREAMLLAIRRKDEHLRSRGIEPGKSSGEVAAWLENNPAAFTGTEVG